MAEDLLAETHERLRGEGAGILRYTRQAFRMLPPMANPCILDVGCGSGGPTRELARLSRGSVIGLDIDAPSLDALARGVKGAGLSDHVRTVRGSMSKMGFADGSFDVVWAEGAICVVGFERGLKTWRRLIRSGGFLVVHEMVWLRPNPPAVVYEEWMARYPEINTVLETAERIPAWGYDLLGHFALPEDAWWIEYYRPLEARIQELRGKHAGEPEALAVLDRDQREIDLYKKCRKWYGSAFFVMRRRSGDAADRDRALFAGYRE